VARFFHPLLTLIASATDRELAKYVQFLKEENKILRKRAGGEIHTRPEERQRLIQFGKALGRAIEELITIVSSIRSHSRGTTSAAGVCGADRASCLSASNRTASTLVMPATPSRQ